MAFLLLAAFFLCSPIAGFRFVTRPLDGYIVRQATSSSTSSSEYTEQGTIKSKDVLGGNILVSGLRNNEEDNFLLGLLNMQPIWERIVVTPHDDSESDSQQMQTKKRYLTRTNKYSGLLDKMSIEPYVNYEDAAAAGGFLRNSTINTWIAFNVTQTAIPSMAQMALDAGVKRFVCTIELSPDRINETLIPEFDEALAKFSASALDGNDVAFTGIRHGLVVPGDEDNSYEIVNKTVRCLENQVERGVLNRVVAELLGVEDSYNNQCGLGSSSAFSSAYLNILRSSGLTRQQEVKKIFNGGIQRVARLTVDEYKAAAERKKVRLEAAEKEKKEEEEAKVLALRAPADGTPEGAPGGSVAVDFDEEDDDDGPTEEQRIKTRTEEILLNVWREYDSRMYAKSTSKLAFFSENKDKAVELAKQEVAAEVLTAEEQARKIEATQRVYDKINEASRRQYSKLLTLERKEMLNQKAVSDTWVKFIFLLLESTMAHCRSKDILFNNLDEFQQTVILRGVANELRALCGLPAYEVIYDPLDASAIIDKIRESKDLAVDAATVEAISQKDAGELASMLDIKYGKLLQSVAALRGAAQIIKAAIETIKKELPPMPPTVAEMRSFESSAKKAEISKIKLDATRNRGKMSQEEESSVGRL